MKYLKTNEELKTIKFSELDNWDVTDILGKNKEKELTGKKDFDLKLGKKVKDLFDEYGLCIVVDPGNWIQKQKLLLDTEKNFKEYRVNIFKKESFEDYLENNDIFDFENMSKKEQQKIEDKYVDYIPIRSNEEYTEFSVFLPLNSKNVELCALCDASNYLKIINECTPEMFTGVEDNILADNTKGFKCFINSKGIKITNDNIEDVPMINERLRKDSKVFSDLNREIFRSETESKKFIQDWLKIIG